MHESESDATQNADNTPSVPQLISTEARVLGVLMEKQLTTPDQYPLTLNSLLSGCNQKSSREPVTHYTQGEIARTLIELEHKKYVQKEYGSRAEKYTQRFISQLELQKKHQALLCVMMLRGPQTLSELNTRTQRMVDFSDKNELQHTLDRLCDRAVPYVVRLSQQPGQRGERFAHLFSNVPNASASPAYDNVESPGNRASEPATAPATASTTASAIPATATSASASNTQHLTPNAELQQEINRLTREVASLKTEASELKQQLAALYELTGNSMP